MRGSPSEKTPVLSFSKSYQRSRRADDQNHKGPVNGDAVAVIAKERKNNGIHQRKRHHILQHSSAVERDRIGQTQLTDALFFQNIPKNSAGILITIRKQLLGRLSRAVIHIGKHSTAELVDKHQSCAFRSIADNKGKDSDNNDDQRSGKVVFFFNRIDGIQNQVISSCEKRNDEQYDSRGSGHFHKEGNRKQDRGNHQTNRKDSIRLPRFPADAKRLQQRTDRFITQLCHLR